jgi:hypothetical protein
MSAAWSAPTAHPSRSQWCSGAQVGSDTGNTQTDEALNGPTRLTFVTLIR